jgi:hypothetical protein
MREYETLLEKKTEIGTNALADEVQQLKARISKLEGQSFRPGSGATELSLLDRVSAWTKLREPPRDLNRTPDLRPNYTVSAESQWRGPWLNDAPGDDGVIRPRQPVEYQGLEWNNAVNRMAGHFHEMRRPIYDEAADKSKEPGPNIPVTSHHQVSW